MKVSFVALGLLLISAAQALPLPETEKFHVAKVQNNTAPVTKSLLHKRVGPGLQWATRGIMAMGASFGRIVSPKPKQPLSYWKDKENSPFESNSWALTQHELNLIDAKVEETGRIA
ncbi:hypothetical protein BHE90_003598 [Fusarium euwallaceae]|uniref:Uncharacterized protein n=4 Tax=Fusarium solani species complex TaxID=232080 RepID=A0A428UE30_9HYPO|nr:hypothetical protein CEP51_002809 [Fusarium floridanum]RSM12433.1 hypothetical protein CEP52_002479 [Fusarium oligoseptatum]RSM17211.1 hypothetical protein CDV31_003926 [Fusarium ambrosium]RTE81906.1 hypothetical protein BHE90_003598 [Fusarium euwallaceae]